MLKISGNTIQSKKRWIQLRDIADTSDATYDNKYNSIVRIYGVAFVIDGQGYLTCGGTPDLRTNTWKYTPDTDLWEEVANFKGAPRTATASFSNGTKVLLLQVGAIIIVLMIFGSFIRMNMMNIKTGNYILWVSLLSLLIIIFFISQL